MKKIELIGTSAAGKTTLLKQMLLEGNDTKEWVTPEKARIEIAMKQKYTLIKDGVVPFIGYNAYYLCKREPHFLASTLEQLLINKYTDAVLETCVADYKCLFELLLDSWSTKTIHIKPYNMIHFCRYYESILIKDVAFLDFFNYDGTIIYEDGIIHNNIGIVNDSSYEKLLKLSPEKRKKIIPSGIIYCNISLEENILRRQKRMASGQITSFELNLNEDELIQLCKEGCVNVSRKAKLMHDLGVPVLELNMSKNNEDNISQIISFINEIDK
jgi:hypothetical protein